MTNRLLGNGAWYMRRIRSAINSVEALIFVEGLYHPIVSNRR
jgi:hypothetical protein